MDGRMEQLFVSGYLIMPAKERDMVGLAGTDISIIRQ